MSRRGQSLLASSICIVVCFALSLFFPPFILFYFINLVHVVFMYILLYLKSCSLFCSILLRVFFLHGMYAFCFVLFIFYFCLYFVFIIYYYPFFFLIFYFLYFRILGVRVWFASFASLRIVNKIVCLSSSQHNLTPKPHRQLETSRNSLPLFSKQFRAMRSNAST